MSSTLAEDAFGEPAEPRTSPSEMLPWIGLLLVLAAVVGALAAVFWAQVVSLPSYLILNDGRAVVSERALTEFVASDAWYVVCGAVVGLGLGILAWKWFKPLGWPSALLAAGAGLVAGLVCWKVGELLGPGDFNERIAQAKPGDLVPINLTLRSWSAPAVWAFAAVTPVLLAASLGSEETTDRPRRRSREATAEPGTDKVDERGVLSELGSPEASR